MSEQVDYTPQSHELAYTFGGRKPVMRITPGTVLRVYTEDCFGGRVRSIHDLPSQVCHFPHLNPVSGPFHVAGARPGDTLALHLVSITPARTWGVSATFPHFGALTSTSVTATLQPPLAERVWWYDIDVDAGLVRYTARGSHYTVDLPLAPMLGTLGVAPAGGEVRMTIVPDTHGGNLDTPELVAGTTIYLPVHVDGALFALGDGHARQGHGEACGVGVETALHTTLIVDLIQGVTTPTPRLESDQLLMSIGCARPLEDAFRISHCDLTHWVSDMTGLDLLDAYQLVSQTTQAPVGNVCDTAYTMLATIPTAHLPAASAYGGIHQRLRHQAAILR